MHKLFFDTEFTGLFDDAKLISIGLINAVTKDTFYAEVADGYAIEQCSDFCKRHVIPLLERGDKVIPKNDLVDSLTAWLEAQGPDTVLLCNSPRDVYQLNELFGHALPANCSLELITYLQNWRRRIYNFNRRIHKKQHLRVHHALDDAIVDASILG